MLAACFMSSQHSNLTRIHTKVVVPDAVPVEFHLDQLAHEQEARRFHAADPVLSDIEHSKVLQRNGRSKQRIARDPRDPVSSKRKLLQTRASCGRMRQIQILDTRDTIFVELQNLQHWPGEKQTFGQLFERVAAQVNAFQSRENDHGVVAGSSHSRLPFSKIWQFDPLDFVVANAELFKVDGCVKSCQIERCQVVTVETKLRRPFRYAAWKGLKVLAVAVGCVKNGVVVAGAHSRAR